MNSNFTCFVGGIIVSQKLGKIEEFQCFLGSFEYFLFNIGFGYICAGFLLLIIIISLFGGIKEDYRWFILLQALWDLLISLYFQCATEIRENIFGYQSSCSLQRWAVEKNLNKLLLKLLLTNPYSALFLLCFTRFLCLYFLNFYDRLTAKRRIAYLIITLNVFFVGMHADAYFEHLTAEIRQNWKAKCREIQDMEKLLACLKSSEYETFGYNILELLRKICVSMVDFKPLACLIFSIFANFMIVARIIKQAAFQIKHNRSNFYASLRVAIVITFQTALNFCIFAITFILYFPDLATKFNVIVVHSGGLVTCEMLKDVKDFSCVFLDLPLWYIGQNGLIDASQTFVQLRIFFECIIVLSIMTGYREAIVKFVKIICSFIKNPKGFWGRINDKTRVVPYK